MNKRIRCILLTLVICLVSVFSPMAAFAETQTEATPTEKTVLTIRIGNKTYSDISTGSEIIGDFDLNNLEFWIVSVNGNILENVGNKSGVKDSMGRNPLEIASVPGKGRLTVTLTYHAQDDPVVTNQAHGFSVAGITFANNKKSLIKPPTVNKVKITKTLSMKKGLKITWKKASVNGYELQYSTNKSFKSAKTIKVKNNKTSYTINKLKSKKTYYIRIRAYKTYKDELGNKNTVFGNWSTVAKKTK